MISFRQYIEQCKPGDNIAWVTHNKEKRSGQVLFKDGSDAAMVQTSAGPRWCHAFCNDFQSPDGDKADRVDLMDYEPWFMDA